MPAVHYSTVSSPTPQKNNRQAVREEECEEHMAQSHPMARLTRTGGEGEKGRSKANSRDSQALPIEQQLHLEYDFYGWRKEGWGENKPKPTGLVVCMLSCVESQGLKQESWGRRGCAEQPGHGPSQSSETFL